MSYVRPTLGFSRVVLLLWLGCPMGCQCQKLLERGSIPLMYAGKRVKRAEH
jgi:hypothetical protein